MTRRLNTGINFFLSPSGFQYSKWRNFYILQKNGTKYTNRRNVNKIKQMFEKFGYNNYVWNTYIFYRNIFKQYKIKLITLNDTNVIVVLSNFSYLMFIGKGHNSIESPQWCNIIYQMRLTSPKNIVFMFYLL